MQTLYTVLLYLALAISIVFALLIFVTGKGDAMSGGSGVRTTFKGRATFEDQISKLTLYLGIGFMCLTLFLDAISAFIERKGG